MREPPDLISQFARIRELAWTGQHLKAIELATRVMASMDTQPDEKIVLLDLRADSYIAQGNLDLVERDSAAMVEIWGNPS